MTKTLVLLSGGLDSATCLFYAKHVCGADNVYALNVYYGQKHNIEIDMAVWQAKNMWGDKWKEHYSELDLSTIMQFNKDCSSLLVNSDKEIPHESYADQLKGGGVVNTYVPYRNGLFLSVAASVAYQLSCDTILYGAHADDAAGRAYPDCTQEFIAAQSAAIQEGTDGGVTLHAPLQNMNKAGVVAFGLQYGMKREDFEHTHSCYEGITGGCGTCGTCRDRIAALDTWEATRGVGQSGKSRKI